MGALIIAGGLAVGVQTGAIPVGGEPDPGTANIWIDTDGGTTCARHSPAEEYDNDGDECDTLQEAYNAAACGDTVLIKAGTYANQTLTEDADLTGCSQRVVFQEAPSESVSIDHITLGTSDTNGPDHLELHGFTMDDGILVGGNSCGGGTCPQQDVTDVVIDGIAGGNVGFQGGDTITVRNSDLGPCHATDDGHCNVGGVAGRQIVLAWAASNITLENNYIHDFICDEPCNGPGNHFECIRLNLHSSSSGGYTLRGNRFWNCQYYNTTLSGASGTTTIENNWFNTCDSIACGSIAMNDDFTGTLYVRGNSFASGGAGIWDPGCDADCNSGIIATGNVFASTTNATQGCHPEVDWYNNVWLTGGSPSTCGTGGTTVASVPYVDGTDSSACVMGEYPCAGEGDMDYHLSGSPGSTNADNLVPTGTTGGCPSVDIDAESRPHDTNCDAGSDER